MPTSSAAHPSAVEAWTTYLTAVRIAAEAVRDRVDDARPPRWPDLVHPRLPYPAGLEDLRRQVLESLATATDATQERRDAIAADIAAMHPPRAATSARTGSLGNALDIMG